MNVSWNEPKQSRENWSYSSYFKFSVGQCHFFAARKKHIPPSTVTRVALRIIITDSLESCRLPRASELDDSDTTRKFRKRFLVKAAGGGNLLAPRLNCMP